MYTKSIRYFIYLLFLSTAFPAFSQQGAILKPMELDSVQADFKQFNEPGKTMQESFFSESLKSLTGYPLNLPNFDFSRNNSFSIDFNKLNGLFYTGFRAGSMGTFYTPYFHDATILSQGAYSLGNKIVVGGYSYGAHSIFSAPIPNQNTTNFDAYGNTLFLQYKVSKNLKIETRFNVTHGNEPGY